MRQSFIKAVFVLAMAAISCQAGAAFVSFSEGFLETDPVVVSTNIVVVSVSSTPESASLSGFHHPGISPSPVTPGKRFAVLFEPGLPGVTPQLVSDYLLFTASDIRKDAQFGDAQDLAFEFFSQDILLADLLQDLAVRGFTYGGGLVEDGTLQDVSALLGTLPEGLIVSMRSGPGEVPEPQSLALALLALVAVGCARKRRLT